MPIGTIKTFKADKGFGFIARNDGPDLFFHISACKGLDPRPGMRVEFEEGRGNKGPAAQNVRSVDTAAASSAPEAHHPASTPATMSHNTSGQFLVPQVTAGIALQAGASSPKRLHPGLLMDRYPEAQHLAKQEQQKPHLERVIAAQPWSPADYQALLERLAPAAESMLNTSKARLALHLSRAGGLENANCCLHPIHGVAYLPGSGLKGLAHAYACHLFFCKNETWRLVQEEGVPDPGGETGAWRDGSEREAFVQVIEDIFGWAPNDERRGRQSTASDAAAWLPRWNREKARGVDAQQGAVIFHDAFGEDPHDGSPPKLEMDILTNHYSPYYQGIASPGDWHSPIPVTFLTIAAGTRFRFRVSKAHPHCSDDLVTAAKRLLLGGLHWLGAGAKTAAGYGWFEDAWSISEQAKAAQAGNLIADLIPQLEAQNQRLWKRTGGSTKKGAAISLDSEGAVVEGETLELKEQSGAREGQYVIIEPNPNSPSKWIPVRVVDELG